MQMFDTGSMVGARAVGMAGVVVGVVTDNRDPKGQGRVKVAFPWMAEQTESHWCRVLTPMAGPGRGFYALPEPKDEVVVAFEMGRPEHAIVMGGVWSGKQKPPEKNSDGKNARRAWVSRSGHRIVLDDTKGKEKVVIEDKTGNNRLEIDSAAGAFAIAAKGPVTVKSDKGITLEAPNGDVTIKCQTLKVDAKAALQVSANAVKMKAKGAVSIAGKPVQLNQNALVVM